MKARYLQVLLFFFIFNASVFAEALYPTVKKISFQDTILFEFFKNYEKNILDTMPYLYFELLSDEFTEEEREGFYNYLIGKERNLCRDESKLEEYCTFLKFIINKNFKDMEAVTFKDDKLNQFKFLFLATYAAKLGNLQEVHSLIKNVRETTIINYYKDFFRVLGIEEPNNFETYYLNCLYDFYFHGNICLIDIDEDKYGFLTFLQAQKYYEEGEYKKAGELFLFLTQKPYFSNLALENAVYAFFHDRDYDKVLEYSKKLPDDIGIKIRFMVSFERGEVFKEDMKFKYDAGLESFLIDNIRKHIKKGNNLDFTNNISFEVISEHLLFWFCLADVVNKKTNLNKQCLKKQWSENTYQAIMGLIRKWYNINFTYEKNDNAKELYKLLFDWGLKNYYPFNFIFAELAFVNNDFEEAQRIYEYFIRYPKNVRKAELEQSYYRIGLIYKHKKSYYTALKFLEKNLEKAFNGIKDKSRIEYVKVLYLRGDCDKVLFYTQYFMEETKDEVLRKEYQSLYDTCYEKMQKSSEDKGETR
jgi:hypothetical protein